ncbi:MAG TPA: hypothetical protein VHF92_03080 [Geodermatophilus sp.]|nr:hypothetical protein [Geodermatophilus sp.]
MRRLFTAVAVLATFLLTLAPAPAGAAEVTEFPFTEAVYNTCNDDMLIVNGTLVDSVEISAKDGRFTYKHRVSWKDVRVESSLGISYNVDSRHVDSFTTKLSNGKETQRSLYAARLRLTPLAGADGELRVQVVYAFQTNAQGITRTFDRYTTTCN